MMARGRSRCGFTLVELMLAMTVFVIIAAALASSFLGGIRLLKATFATAEMSLQARELRDRLLFHVTPPHDGMVWTGLLAGTNRVSATNPQNREDVLNVHANPPVIQMGGTAMRIDGQTVETVNQTMEVTFQDYGKEERRFFNRDRVDERWLNPGGMNLMAEASDTAPVLSWAKNKDNAEDRTRFYIRLAGRMDVAGLPIRHDERIVVPVFGCQQETRPDGKGGLDK